MITPAVVSAVLLFRALRTERDHTITPHPSPSERVVLKRSSPFRHSTIVLAGQQLVVDVVIISLVATQTEIGWYAVGRDADGHLALPAQHHRDVAAPRARARAHEEDAGAAYELLALSHPHDDDPRGPDQRRHHDRRRATGDAALRRADFAPAGAVLAAGGLVLLLMFPTILIGGIARATGKVRIFNVPRSTLATILTIPLDLILVPWTRDQFNNGAIERRAVVHRHRAAGADRAGLEGRSDPDAPARGRAGPQVRAGLRRDLGRLAAAGHVQVVTRPKMFAYGPLSAVVGFELLRAGPNSLA